MLSTIDKGNIGLFRICADLTLRGFVVLLPQGGQPHYDVVIEKDKFFKKIQVRYITPKNGTLKIKLYTNNSKNITYHNINNIDMFAIFDPINDKCYYVPLEDFPNNKTTINIRLKDSLNNQNKKIILAAKYSNI